MAQWSDGRRWVKVQETWSTTKEDEGLGVFVSEDVVGQWRRRGLLQGSVSAPVGLFGGLVTRSQLLRPLWQVCGPSPPPTSPSAGCPWPSKGQKTDKWTDSSVFSWQFLFTTSVRSLQPNTSLFLRLPGGNRSVYLMLSWSDNRHQMWADEHRHKLWMTVSWSENTAHQVVSWLFVLHNGWWVMVINESRC